jgi:hypothetical protein
VGSPLLDETSPILITCMTLYTAWLRNCRPAGRDGSEHHREHSLAFRSQVTSPHVSFVLMVAAGH